MFSKIRKCSYIGKYIFFKLGSLKTHFVQLFPVSFAPNVKVLLKCISLTAVPDSRAGLNSDALRPQTRVII